MKREKPHFPGGKNSALWNLREADRQVPRASRSGSPDRGRARPATEHCCLRSACVGGRGLRQSPLPMRLTGTVLSQSAFRTGAEKTSPCAGFSQVVAASQSRVVFASDCGLPSERRMPQAGLLRRAKHLPPPGHPTREGSRQRRAASGQFQRRAPRPAPEPWLPVGYEATPHDLCRRSLPTSPSATGARPACAEVLRLGKTDRLRPA